MEIKSNNSNYRQISTKLIIFGGLSIGQVGRVFVKPTTDPYKIRRVVFQPTNDL